MEKFNPFKRNCAGQILVESVFLALLMSALLIVFGKLIELQRERQSHFSFSNKKEIFNVQK